MAVTFIRQEQLKVSGTALQVPRINAAGTGWEFAGLPIAVYAATLANVANTVAETTILSFTIPANSMSDGDVIQIEMVALEKQNSGGVLTATTKLNCGAGAQVTIQNGASYPDGATEYRAYRIVRLMRVGSTVDVLAIGSAGNMFPAWLATAGSQVYTAGSSTPTNFTSDFTVSIKTTLSGANPTFYIKPQSAKIIHFKS